MRPVRMPKMRRSVFSSVSETSIVRGQRGLRAGETHIGLGPQQHRPGRISAGSSESMRLVAMMACRDVSAHHHMDMRVNLDIAARVEAVELVEQLKHGALDLALATRGRVVPERRTQ